MTGEELQPDDALLRLARALLAYLRAEGVPDPDVMGAARAGLVIAAVREGRGAEARRLRAWLAEVPPADPATCATPFARYVSWAGPRWAVFVVLWRRIAEARPSSDDDVLTLLCRALDRVEGERLVAALEAR